MTLGMTLVYPVQWGAAMRRTRLSPCAFPMFCSVALWYVIRENIIFRYLPRKKEKSAKNAKKKCAIREFSVKCEKKLHQVRSWFMSTRNTKKYQRYKNSTKLKNLVQNVLHI